MQAIRLLDWKSSPVMVEVPQPVPGPNDVVIRVGGAGVCQTDLHVVHDLGGQSARHSVPFTLGHENAGWVHETGAAVRGFSQGDPVAVYGAWGCGRCQNCLVGMENYCINPAEGDGMMGIGRDGGIAEFLLVPGAERHLLHLPEGLEPRHAAPLTDAALTPRHAIGESIPRLVAGSTAVVLGAGGLGQFAVQLLKAMSSTTVIAVDLDAETLQRATANGADEVLIFDDDVLPQLRKIVGVQGAALVLDFVGIRQTMVLASQIVGKSCDLVIVAAGGGALEVNQYTMPPGARIRTPFLGTRDDLRHVLDLAAGGRIKSEIVTYPLSEAVTALKDLEEGRIRGRRAVIVPELDATTHAAPLP